MKHPIEINEPLKFGMYSGYSPKEIWEGSSEINSIIENYLQYIFDFFGKQFTHYNNKVKICKPSENIINSKLNKIVNEINLSFKIIVKDGFLYIIDNKYSKEIIEFLEMFLKQNFENIDREFLLIGRGSESKFEMITSIEKLNSKPSYILWCMKNFNHKFYLDSIDIKELENTNCKKLQTFEVEIINDNCLRFNPKFKFWKTNFPDEIKIKNEKIIEKYYKWADLQQPFREDSDDKEYWEGYDDPEEFFKDNYLGGENDGYTNID